MPESTESKDVGPKSLSIKERVRIDWLALKWLSKIVGSFSDAESVSSTGGVDVSSLKPPEAVYPILPMVASAIVHTKDSEVPLILPTQQEIKAVKPWLGTVSRVIGGFSKNWSERFDRYIEQRGGKVVADVASKVVDVAEIFEGVDNPRRQFVFELARMYNMLTKEEYERQDGIFGPEMMLVGIERKMLSLFWAMNNVKETQKNFHWFNDLDFPLFGKLIRLAGFPPKEKGQASIAASEMMQGVRKFLVDSGLSVREAPAPIEFDLFDLDSWDRGFADLFASSKLEQVKRAVPEILYYTYWSLPENGNIFSRQIYGLARDVLVAKGQRQSDREIAGALFS